VIVKQEKEKEMYSFSDKFLRILYGNLLKANQPDLILGLS